MRRTALALILVAAPAFGQIRGDQPASPLVIGAAPGQDDEKLMAPRLFQRTLAAPGPAIGADSKARRALNSR